jgi:hypothetical protein
MPRRCAVGALIVLAIAVLAGPAAAQAPSGYDYCASPPTTSDLRMWFVAQGRTLTWPVQGSYLPGCDEPGDPLSVTVDWGDGTSSGPSPAPVVAQHIYQRPGKYQLVMVQRNERTGVARSDEHYQANVLRTGLIVAHQSLSWWPGRRFSGNVASFSPQGAEASAVPYAVTIAWGDGTTSRGTVVERWGVVRVRGAHTWRRTLRNRQVTVTVKQPTTGAVLQIRRPLKPRK